MSSTAFHGTKRHSWFATSFVVVTAILAVHAGLSFLSLFQHVDLFRLEGITAVAVYWYANEFRDAVESIAHRLLPHITVSKRDVEIISIVVFAAANFALPAVSTVARDVSRGGRYGIVIICSLLALGATYPLLLRIADGRFEFSRYPDTGMAFTFLFGLIVATVVYSSKPLLNFLRLLVSAALVAYLSRVFDNQSVVLATSFVSIVSLHLLFKVIEKLFPQIDLFPPPPRG